VNVLHENTNHASKRGTDCHRRNENTRRYFTTKRYDDEKCADDCCNSETTDHVPSLIAVAELVVAMSVSALLEQNLHAFRHVNPEEHVGVADDRREHRQGDCFCNGVVRKKLLPEDLHLEVPLYDKGAVKAAENSNDDIEQNLKKVPAAIVFDLEHDKLAGSKRIHCL
jgi:hypothetical protein